MLCFTAVAFRRIFEMHISKENIMSVLERMTYNGSKRAVKALKSHFHFGIIIVIVIPLIHFVLFITVSLPFSPQV